MHYYTNISSQQIKLETLPCRMLLDVNWWSGRKDSENLSRLLALTPWMWHWPPYQLLTRFHSLQNYYLEALKANRGHDLDYLDCTPPLTSFTTGATEKLRMRPTTNSRRKQLVDKKQETWVREYRQIGRREWESDWFEDRPGLLGQMVLAGAL